MQKKKKKEKEKKKKKESGGESSLQKILESSPSFNRVRLQS